MGARRGRGEDGIRPMVADCTRTMLAGLVPDWEVMTNEHPELAGYEPGDGRPLRSPHLLRAMRVIVVVGIIALVLPGLATTISVGTTTANTACVNWVNYERPDATGADARFEFFGPGGIGWQCYSVGGFGGDELVASLGIIPSGARLPIGPPTVNS